MYSLSKIREDIKDIETVLNEWSEEHKYSELQISKARIEIIKLKIEIKKMELNNEK